MADDVAGEALRVEVNGASELAQAAYFAEIMRNELIEARKAAKEAQRHWSTRQVNETTEIPERVVLVKGRVQEANRVLKALKRRFPGI
ncbi:MAG TPA: hypothetical protein VGI68_25835 [Mycobacterium sp.]